MITLSPWSVATCWITQTCLWFCAWYMQTTFMLQSSTTRVTLVSQTNSYLTTGSQSQCILCFRYLQTTCGFWAGLCVFLYRLNASSSVQPETKLCFCIRLSRLSATSRRLHWHCTSTVYHSFLIHWGGTAATYTVFPTAITPFVPCLNLPGPIEQQQSYGVCWWYLALIMQSKPIPTFEFNCRKQAHGNKF
jgi:hypothetical protein